MSEPTAQVVELPGGQSNNRSQDAYEALRELLAEIGVSPSQMRVDWATEGREAPIVIGALSVVEVLRLMRAIREGLRKTQPANLLEERPHRPMVGETVLDEATDRIGEVTGYLLRPVEDGEPWAAGAESIRRPDRDRLMKVRMAQLDRDRRATPPSPPALEPAHGDRVAT